AIIELTNGNWSDPRVAASMGGIVVVLMFVYLMAATALAGRTWGMWLVAVRTVDARTGMAPTTGQCVRRAFGYMLSLALLGVGLLYALFDAEGRAAHDHLSGTIVIAD
ncbi:MAG TPA: RDD family protein, partial [Pyrinomonadaceae bacterium]|nr:RDD family protein [Pyrinomonadaceae bacterium]